MLRSLKDLETFFDDERWAVRYLVGDPSNWRVGKKVLLSPHLPFQEENPMTSHDPAPKIPQTPPPDPQAPAEPAHPHLSKHPPEPASGLQMGHDAPRHDPKTDPQQHQQKSIGGQKHGRRK